MFRWDRNTGVSQALSQDIGTRVTAIQIPRNISIRLHNIQLITKYLSNDFAQTLVHALVIGRVGYCNSLLFGLPAVPLRKLQRL